MGEYLLSKDGRQLILKISTSSNRYKMWREKKSHDHLQPTAYFYDVTPTSTHTHIRSFIHVGSSLSIFRSSCASWWAFLCVSQPESCYRPSGIYHFPHL